MPYFPPKDWKSFFDNLKKVRYYSFDRSLFYLYNTYQLCFKKKSLTNIVNEKEIRVFGLRRSGIHGIIRWISEQIRGNVLILYNVKLNQNPFHSRYINFNESYLLREVLGDFSQKECLIYSYEDYDLADIDYKRYFKRRELYIGSSSKTYDILILRDPFNMYASRLKGCWNRDFMTTKKKKHVLDLWVDYAKEYLGETSFLKNQKVIINYNRWFVDKTYRKEIANFLGLKFSDKGFGQLGIASSFDGDCVTDATKLNVLPEFCTQIASVSYVRQFFVMPSPYSHH